MTGVSARRTRVSPAVKKPRAKEDRHFVTALSRGLGVLSCFRAGDAVLSNGDIASRCQLPKSTVSRLTYTLTRLGFLHYVQDRGKYRLGISTLALGSAMLSRLAIRQLARPMMQELADFSQSVVALGVRVQLGIIYVETCRSQAALTLSLDVGSRVPIATTAIGRAYLAVASETEREDLLAQIKTADKVGWPRVREAIDASVAHYRRLGCCSSFGEWQSDVNGIAVGFHPGGGLPPMVINCGGAAFSLPPAFLLDQVRPRLITLVRNLEASLGQD
jgi:DNA-binding IclR family transcriptional regulator